MDETPYAAATPPWGAAVTVTVLSRRCRAPRKGTRSDLEAPLIPPSLMYGFGLAANESSISGKAWRSRSDTGVGAVAAGAPGGLRPHGVSKRLS